MPLMTWTEEMSVGVKALDEDHKKLVALLNELHEGILAGQQKVVLEKVIEKLVEYTIFHFGREEKLFTDAGFPASAEHKREHDLLSRRARNLQSRFECGQSTQLSLESMEFLKSWLTSHIMGSDQEYRPYLQAKGIR
jgi:hemerythrin-like metal-binding protein